MAGQAKVHAGGQPTKCWNLTTTVDTEAVEWKVWATYIDALRAAKLDIEGASFDDNMAQRDNLTGLTYFRGFKIKPGVVSLDAIDEVMQEYRYTWEEELGRVGIPDQAVLNGNIKAHIDKDGKIVWDLLQEATEPKPKKKAKAKSLAKTSKLAGGEPRPASRHKARQHSQSKGARSKVEERIPSIWGRTYIVPGREIGQGSYHFVDEGKSYLNYEQMPQKLEDGSAYPKRLDFDRISYDAEHRRFQGVIEWKISHRSRWEYDLTFDARFIGIRGACKMFKPGSTEPYSTILFQKDAKYVWDKASKEEVQKYLGRGSVAMDQESMKIVESIGRALQQDVTARRKNGQASASASDTLGLVFGRGMMTYARDHEADMKLTRR
jgi:hypothetical protein